MDFKVGHKWENKSIINRIEVNEVCYKYQYLKDEMNTYCAHASLKRRAHITVRISQYEETVKHFQWKFTMHSDVRKSPENNSNN